MIKINTMTLAVTRLYEGEFAVNGTDADDTPIWIATFCCETTARLFVLGMKNALVEFWVPPPTPHTFVGKRKP